MRVRVIGQRVRARARELLSQRIAGHLGEIEPCSLGPGDELARDRDVDAPHSRFRSVHVVSADECGDGQIDCSAIDTERVELLVVDGDAASGRGLRVRGWGHDARAQCDCQCGEADGGADLVGGSVHRYAFRDRCDRERHHRALATLIVAVPRRSTRVIHIVSAALVWRCRRLRALSPRSDRAPACRGDRALALGRKVETRRASGLAIRNRRSQRADEAFGVVHNRPSRFEQQRVAIAD